MLHTLIASGSLAVFFYAGVFFTKRSVTESVICHMLDKLEREGLIATVTGADGEKDIIPISEIIAEAVNTKIRSK